MPAKARSAEELGAPTWFVASAEGLKPILPKWMKSLPVIALRSGTPLPAGLGAWVLGALAVTEEEAARHDLIDLLRRHADPTSLDRWTADALHAWIGAGSPLRESWLVPGVALLGGAAAANVLRDTVRRWSKDREKVLATRGLDALGRIDDPAALAAVATLAAGATGRGVTREAQREVTKRAAVAGTSPEQLTDLHVPTGGLDPRGERAFYVGARSFRAVLGRNLALALFESTGRRRVTLPRPSLGDDPAVAGAARLTWMETRIEVRRVVREQARRFERLMVSGREWTLPEFRENVLAHPILGRIASLLVWRCDDGRKLRVAEDGSFADAADREVGLDPARRLQLMHPLHTEPSELAAWRERFADYGLVAPFPQIGRETFRCDAALFAQTFFAASAHAPLKPGALYGILDNDGWSLGAASGGLVSSSWKDFATDGVRAAISYSGLIPGALARSPGQTVAGCSFFPMPGDPANAPLPLGRVPAMAFSESVRRLHRLCSAEL